MAGETIITIVGNLTADPELRFTPTGKAVAQFTVASTPRVWNSQTQQFENGDALFMRCEAWGTLAENIAHSVDKGNRVIVVGELSQQNWETKEGEKRSTLKMRATSVGADLTWATASLQKSAPQQQRQQQPRDTQQANSWGAPASNDNVWGNTGGSNMPDEQPPF